MDEFHRAEKLDLEGLLVNVVVQQKRSFWRGKETIDLRFGIQGNRNGDNDYRRHFESTYVVSPTRKHTPRPDSEINQWLLDQTVDTAATITNAMRMSEPMQDELRARMVQTVSVLTDRPSLFAQYEQSKDELKTRAQQEALRQRKQQSDRKKLQVQQDIREKLVHFETKLRYGASIDASADLSHVPTRDTIRDYVRLIFDANDNLQHRRVEGQRQGFRAYVTGIAGEGMFNRLFNLEADMDEFYIAVLERTQGMCGEREPTFDEYTRAFVETHTRETALELVNRECDDNVRFLEAMQQVREESKFDYRRAFSSMIDVLSNDPYDYFSFAKDDMPLFGCDLTSGSTEDEFKQKTKELIDKLKVYFVEHSKDLLAPHSLEPRKGTYVLLRTEDKGITRGSTGKTTYKGNGYLNVKFNYFAPGSLPTPDPVRYHFNNFRAHHSTAVPIRERYGSSAEVCASYIVRSLATTTLEQFRKATNGASSQQIDQAFPHLRDQITYHQKFRDARLAQVEALYAQHR